MHFPQKLFQVAQGTDWCNFWLRWGPVGFPFPTSLISFFFFLTRAQFFISSFLAFEVLLDDILGLRFFAIVLNYHTTATNHFTGFSLSVNFTEAYPFP